MLPAYLFRLSRGGFGVLSRPATIPLEILATRVISSSVRPRASQEAMPFRGQAADALFCLDGDVNLVIVLTIKFELENSPQFAS